MVIPSLIGNTETNETIQSSSPNPTIDNKIEVSMQDTSVYLPQATIYESSLQSFTLNEYFENGKILSQTTDDARHPIIQKDNMGNMYALWDEGDNHFSGRTALFGNIFGKFWDVNKAKYPGDPNAWDTSPTKLSSEATRGAYEPDMVIDENGLVHFVFQAYDNTPFSTNLDIYYKTWDAKLGLLSSPTKISASTSHTARFAEIEMDTQNNIHITYETDKDIGSNGPDVDVFYRFWNKTQGAWSQEMVISAGSDYSSTHSSITVDINDVLHVVWTDNITSVADVLTFGLDSDIYYRNKNKNQWSPLQRISPASFEESDNPRINSDKFGNLHVVWSDGTLKILGSDIVYRKFNFQSSSWTDMEVVSNSGQNTSGLADIIIDDIGNIHLMWVETALSNQETSISYRFKDYYSQEWKSKIKVSVESDDATYHPAIEVMDNRMYFTWDDISNINGSGNDIDILFATSSFTIGPTWFEIPENQGTIQFNQFSYNLNASDFHGIDTWSVNDTLNFSIDQNGVLTNATELMVGIYDLQVAVNNTLGFTTVVEITVSVLPPIPAAPTAPYNLMVAYNGSHVVLNWNKPTHSIGSAISNYNIYRSVNLGNYELVDPTGNLNYFDSDIILGVLYNYTITAVNGLGEGGPSNSVSIKPVTVPNPPINLIATFNGISIELEWDQPLNLGGEPEVTYNLYREINNSIFIDLLNTTKNTSFADSDFNLGSTYSYKVTAFNSIGESVFSNVVTITPELTPTDTNLTGTETSPPINTTTQPPSDLDTKMMIVIIIVSGVGVTAIIIIIIKRRRG